MSEDVIFELSDIEVDTLGLVNQGANREEFALLKNAEGQELGTESTDVSAEITKTVWQKIIGLFQKAARDVTTTETEDDPEEEDGEEVEVMAKAESEPEVEITTKVATFEPEHVVTEPEIVATTKQDLPVSAPSPEDQTITKDNTMEANVMAENEISKADYEAIAKRLESAETELAKARAEKEQQVWLTKAAGFSYLPVAQAELAAKLYTIAKLDAGLAEWVAEVFKAVDNMVADSGLFVEKGHNIPEVDAVTKAMQAVDPRAALLGLPKVEAEAYLAAVRSRGRK